MSIGLGIGLSLRGAAITDLGAPLDLNFAANTYTVNGATSTLADAVTFARGSTGTIVNSSGVIETIASGQPRIGHHIWSGSAWINEGILIEPSKTQLLHTTDALVTQSLTVSAQKYTLHFTGTGTVTLSGASTAGPLVGTGTGEQNRVALSFTPSAGTLTLTVTGTVTNAQLEAGDQTSYIPNTAASGTVIRARDEPPIPAANAPWPQSAPLALSIAIEGRLTYSDNGSGGEAVFFNWANGQEYILARLNTFSSFTGRPQFAQKDGTTEDIVSGSASAYSPGVNDPFSIASRHGSTFLQGAVDGVATSEDTTPTAFPDLETTDIQLTPTFSGTIRRFRIWKRDIGSDGIEEESA